MVCLSSGSANGGAGPLGPSGGWSRHEVDPVPRARVPSYGLVCFWSFDGPAAAQTAMEPVAEFVPARHCGRGCLWAYTQLRLSALIGGLEDSARNVAKLVPDGAEAAAISAVSLFVRATPPRCAIISPLCWPANWVRRCRGFGSPASLVDAAAAHVLGDRDDAARGVVRTLVLGAPEELVQPFAEAPRDIPGLLALLDAYPQAASTRVRRSTSRSYDPGCPRWWQPDLRSTIGPTASTHGVGSPGHGRCPNRSPPGSCIAPRADCWPSHRRDPARSPRWRRSRRGSLRFCRCSTRSSR